MPPLPVNEKERQKALRDSGILDIASSEQLDNVVFLAQTYFGSDMAMVSLADDDRQFFPAACGIADKEAPRELSFCTHMIALGDELVVSNALVDERFCQNPFVVGEPGVRAYLGTPIRYNGFILGALCVVFLHARTFTLTERQYLRTLASLAEREIALVSQITQDALTKVLNKHGLELGFEKILAASDRDWGAPVSCLFFDLNGFKEINDKHGHAVGNLMLQNFATALQEVNRAGSSLVCRYGGDEFVVLMQNADRQAAAKMLERLDAAIAVLNAQNPLEACELCYSVGIAALPAGLTARPEDRTLDALIHTADEAMYADKRSKRASRASGLGLVS